MASAARRQIIGGRALVHGHAYMLSAVQYHADMSPLHVLPLPLVL